MSRSSRRSTLALVALLAAAGCASSGPDVGPRACKTVADCDDGNPCTTDACSAGRCTHAPLPADAFCSGGAGQFCDGAGHCVECNHDVQCGGPTTGCQHPACAAHSCDPVFVTSGTASTTQVAGDCKKVLCDGAGGTQTVADDTDLPNDGKECTVDACAGGVPTFTPKTVGTSCGGGQFQCTAAGDCGCQSNADCPLPQTCGGGGTAKVCGCTRKTCAQVGATCGAPADGCGGTLSCDSLTKNGTETDVDCGGSAAGCATRCAQGKACVVNGDCASGFCADGVCCNSACNGTCQACTAAKKGQGSDGVCGAIVAGSDPDNECAATAAATCGTTGTCNGSGACALWAAGTICGAASCTGSTMTPAATCDGSGTCGTPASGSCAPYACGVGACKTAPCGGDGDCASGYFCNASNACVPTGSLAIGSICTSGGQCASGFCVDGFCCDTACNGTCVTCSQALGASSDGTCSFALAGTDPHSTCPATAGTCGLSGLCASGGACAPYPDPTTQCAAATCSGPSTVTPAAFCDGVGGCPTPADQNCSGATPNCVAGACGP